MFLRFVVALLVAPFAFANTPPLAPVITEPALDFQQLNGADVHMVARFSDPDGDGHLCSDWEIADVSGVVWSASCAGAGQKLHIHLGDGVFSGTHAGEAALHPNSEFTLRVRQRDDSGDSATEWSAWSSRPFRTAVPQPIEPLRVDGVLASPQPRWSSGDSDLMVPAGLTLDLETVDGTSLLHLAAEESDASPEPRTSRDVVRARLRFVGLAESIPESELTFDDPNGATHTVYLPSIAAENDGELYLWISANGTTHDARAEDRTPDFKRVARGAPVPWDAARGFRIEKFATGFELPVSVVAVPEPGPDADSPFLYVAELYGSVKMVTRSGSVSDYATNLLNFDPHDAIPGSGERGLGGITIDPANGDVIVSGIYRVGDGPKIAPRILRLQSDDGGRTAARIVPVLEFEEEIYPSHQISNVAFGPDGKLYVHVGSAFDWRSHELGALDGKILRMNPDGSAPEDNPFYDATNGIDPADYTFASGFRNPFGGAWRSLDQSLYEVENGPAVDRIAVVRPGTDYGWDGTDESMRLHASFNWPESVAPVQIAFTERDRFNGSGFPAERMESAFVTESGPTWATGPQRLGKRVSEFLFAPGGELISGPEALATYTGSGKATAAGLAAGEGGLYFTDLYKDVLEQSPFDRGANVFLIRWTGFADFTARFVSGSTVVVTDQSSATEGSPVRWDFGDGTTGAGKSVVHHYAKSGTYLIRENVGGNEILHAARRVHAGADSPEVVVAYYENEELDSPRAIEYSDSFSFDWAQSGTPSDVSDRGFVAFLAVDVTPRFSETYTFRLQTENRARLLIDGNIILDRWAEAGEGSGEVRVDLVAGRLYQLAVQYADDPVNHPTLRLDWESPSQGSLVVPNTVSNRKRRAAGSGE
jgi:glucose/arabinose dehydrogenase